MCTGSYGKIFTLIEPKILQQKVLRNHWPASVYNVHNSRSGSFDKNTLTRQNFSPLQYLQITVCWSVSHKVNNENWITHQIVHHKLGVFSCPILNVINCQAQYSNTGNFTNTTTTDNFAKFHWKVQWMNSIDVKRLHNAEQTLLRSVSSELYIFLPFTGD